MLTAIEISSKIFLFISRKHLFWALRTVWIFYNLEKKFKYEEISIKFNCKTKNWFLLFIYDYTLLLLKSFALFFKLVFSFCTWYMFWKGEKDCHTDFSIFQKKYYIIAQLYSRKFCDGHILQVLACSLLHLYEYFSLWLNNIVWKISTKKYRKKLT